MSAVGRTLLIAGILFGLYLVFMVAMIQLDNWRADRARRRAMRQIYGEEWYK